ncbi:hypothetical protein IBTHAUMO2_1050031 [Nitrosopumilaceae archaeon]|nr:hypothetical protein IBTHAUMO2_1050031 [Nitrosopumilaceae archaeon]
MIGEVESDDIGEITYDPVIKKCKFTLFARYYPPEEQLKAMGVQGIEILGIKQSEDKFVISCQIDMVL